MRGSVGGAAGRGKGAQLKARPPEIPALQRAALQGLANVPGELRAVDDHLREQRGGVQVFVAGLDGQVGDRRLDRWRVQRPLHGQLDERGGVGDAHHVVCRRRCFAQGERLGFDAVQDVHDAAVFQPGLVVEKAAQLL